jgi:hypothetical protein
VKEHLKEGGYVACVADILDPFVLKSPFLVRDFGYLRLRSEDLPLLLDLTPGKLSQKSGYLMFGEYFRILFQIFIFFRMSAVQGHACLDKHTSILHFLKTGYRIQKVLAVDLVSKQEKHQQLNLGL